MRQQIINALRTDFATITVENNYNNDIKEVFKQLKEFGDINDANSPSIYFQLMPSKARRNENFYEWTQPVFVLIYFTVKHDISKEGLYEAQAETLIDDVLALFDTYTTTHAIDGVEAISIDEIDTYIDTDNTKGLITMTLIIEHTQ